MPSRNLLVGAVFVVLLALIGVLLYFNFLVPAPPPGPGAAPAGPGLEATGPLAPAAPTEPSATPAGGTERIVLYFQGQDLGLLFPEVRETEVVADGGARARRVLEELAKGPQEDLLPTLPPGARLRQVYFDSAGIAYVDFSRELRDHHSGGSSEELMTVESVIHTLVRNVPEVRAVQFLIEGRPTATLAGHVDLGQPLEPAPEYVAP